MRERIVLLLCIALAAPAAWGFEKGHSRTDASYRDAANDDAPATKKARRRKKKAAAGEKTETKAPAIPENEPPVDPALVAAAPQPHAHGGPQGCQYYGANACEQCLAFWAVQGSARNNHFCKDKSRANGTKGWDCFNFAEDTSHGYECIEYCPPDTATCEGTNCNMRKSDGSAWHDHPLRRTRNKHTGRVLGPPGSAPVPHQGKESRDKCNW